MHPSGRPAMPPPSRVVPQAGERPRRAGFTSQHAWLRGSFRWCRGSTARRQVLTIRIIGPLTPGFAPAGRTDGVPDAAGIIRAAARSSRVSATTSLPRPRRDRPAPSSSGSRISPAGQPGRPIGQAGSARRERCHDASAMQLRPARGAARSAPHIRTGTRREASGRRSREVTRSSRAQLMMKRAPKRPRPQARPTARGVCSRPGQSRPSGSGG